jgi:hypothetical protein
MLGWNAPSVNTHDTPQVKIPNRYKQIVGSLVSNVDDEYNHMSKEQHF